MCRFLAKRPVTPPISFGMRRVTPRCIYLVGIQLPAAWPHDAIANDLAQSRTVIKLIILYPAYTKYRSDSFSESLGY